MIAETIANQLGVPTLALLGAHSLVDLEDGLQFRIRGCEKINLIQIILDPCDTYTVRFGNIQLKGKKTLGVSYSEVAWQLVSTHSDIYCDMLHDLIQQETGLYTSF
ncbi:MAG: hypothetical protein WC314_27555 [Vulcanimicrobiota bacterium]